MMKEEDLFFKYAQCFKCRLGENDCKCEIMDAVLWLSQFKKAVHEVQKK